MHYRGFAPTFVCHPSLGDDRACHQNAASATSAGPRILASTAGRLKAQSQATEATARWAAMADMVPRLASFASF